MRAGNSRVRSATRGVLYVLAPETLRLLGAASFCLYAFPHFLHNLVNALPRKFELVRNKAERFASSVQIKNLGVSVRVRLRAWSQRAPLPVANRFKFLNLVSRQLSLAAALTKIPNPGAKRQRGSVDDLYVRCGNSAMPFAVNEVIECCNCEIETGDVVHTKDNNTIISYNK